MGEEGDTGKESDSNWLVFPRAAPFSPVVNPPW